MSEIKLNNKYRLVEIKNGSRGQEFPLKEGNNLIGRSDPSSNNNPELNLEPIDLEAKVSRKHAQIFCSATTIELEDLNSLNGTFINRGDRLRAGIRYAIKPGDEIVFGKSFLLLENH